MKIFYLTTLRLLLIGVALISLVSGCAKPPTATSQPNQPLPAVSTTNVPDTPVWPAEDGVTPIIDKRLPEVTLTDEIVFKVLLAEIAFQRRDFSTAFASMMAAAQQTRDPRLTKRAMEMALLSKQPLQAYSAARLWHQYAPNSDEATQFYLSFLVLNNSWEEIKSTIAARLAAASPKERGLLLLQTQRLLAHSSDKQKAFKVLDELCKPYVGHYEAHLALAQGAYAANNATRASTEAHTALRLNPSSQLAALTLAQVSRSPNASLKVLEDFLTNNPSAYEVRRSYAGILIEQKQFAKARHQYERLAQNRPQDPSNLYALGVLSLQLNDIATAEKKLKEFVSLIAATSNEQQDPTMAYIYLAQIADDRNDGTEALNWISQVPSYDEKNANYFNAQLRRAALIAKYQSLEQARQFLSTLKTSPEEQIRVMRLDAELLRKANRDMDAYTSLEKATEQYPDNPDLLFDFGMMAEKLKRYDQMEQAFKRAIQLDPENQQAYNALGYSLAERNIRLDEARTLIERALALAPNDPFIIDSMGWLEFRENHLETALAFLQRAYQLRSDPEIAIHIGEVLWRMGEQQKAKHIWKEAQQKDPDNGALKETLERLQVNL